MDDKNGYEFSVLETRGQLILLRFPLHLRSAQIMPGLGGKYWAIIGWSVLDRSVTVAEFPGSLTVLAPREEEGT